MPRGWISNVHNLKIYDMWRHMLLRTKKGYWIKYPTYTGTTVCDEWKILSNFVNNIKEIEGYDLWVKNTKRTGIMLDKDTKIPGNKRYSKETCRFITHEESNRDVNKRNPETLHKATKKFVETHSIPMKAYNKKTKEILKFPSIKEFCRKLNMNQRNVCMIISEEEKYKSHKSIKGWIIKKNTGDTDFEDFKEYYK